MTTMKDYIDNLIQTLPKPETLKQEQLEKTLNKIFEDLRRYGEARYDWSYSTHGTYKNCIESMNRATKVLKGLGYEVTESINAESNRSCSCRIHVSFS